MAQFTVNAHRFDPYKNFKFRVKWDGRYVAGVSKVSALKRTTEVVKHREGGDPSDAAASRPGAPKYEAITLERGVTHDPEFENWANKVWNFENAQALGAPRRSRSRTSARTSSSTSSTRPARRSSPTRSTAAGSRSTRPLPDLDANANAVAIQHIKLENEGWIRDLSVKEPNEPTFDRSAGLMTTMPATAGTPCRMGGRRGAADGGPAAGIARGGRSELSADARGRLPVGARDARLLALREWAFGQRVVAVAKCPSCGADLELEFDTADVRVPASEPQTDELTIGVDGFEVRFRLPDGFAVRQVADEPTVAAARDALLRRCVVSVSSRRCPGRSRRSCRTDSRERRDGDVRARPAGGCVRRALVLGVRTQLGGGIRHRAISLGGARPVGAPVTVGDRDPRVGVRLDGGRGSEAQPAQTRGVPGVGRAMSSFLSRLLRAVSAARTRARLSTRAWSCHVVSRCFEPNAPASRLHSSEVEGESLLREVHDEIDAPAVTRVTRAPEHADRDQRPVAPAPRRSAAQEVEVPAREIRRADSPEEAPLVGEGGAQTVDTPPVRVEAGPRAGPSELGCGPAHDPGRGSVDGGCCSDTGPRNRVSHGALQRSRRPNRSTPKERKPRPASAESANSRPPTRCRSPARPRSEARGAVVPRAVLSLPALVPAPSASARAAPGLGRASPPATGDADPIVHVSIGRSRSAPHPRRRRGGLRPAPHRRR